MKITKVQLVKGDWGKTKAMVSITFDDCFVVSGLRVVEGEKGAFVSMPNRKTAEGEYKDTAFPITKEFRKEHYKVNSSKELTKKQATEVIDRLSKKVEEPKE